mmetsp:Transcript_41906/g.108497  ORF Transcript_41906/g.108497 Transcript_41906/m.108497 type:complete len:260 (-) Transcript_41906:1110-1889(-)
MRRTASASTRPGALVRRRTSSPRVARTPRRPRTRCLGRSCPGRRVSTPICRSTWTRRRRKVMVSGSPPTGTRLEAIGSGAARRPPCRAPSATRATHCTQSLSTHPGARMRRRGSRMVARRHMRPAMVFQLPATGKRHVPIGSEAVGMSACPATSAPMLGTRRSSSHTRRRFSSTPLWTRCQCCLSTSMMRRRTPPGSWTRRRTSSSLKALTCHTASMLRATTGRIRRVWSWSTRRDALATRKMSSLQASRTPWRRSTPT